MLVIPKKENHVIYILCLMSFRFYETGYFSDRVLGIDFCKGNSLIKVNLLSRLTLPFFFFSFFTFESFCKLWILTLGYVYIYSIR